MEVNAHGKTDGDRSLGFYSPIGEGNATYFFHINFFYYKSPSAERRESSTVRLRIWTTEVLASTVQSRMSKRTSA